MARIKKETEDTDSWLAYWANNPKQEIKEEEDTKQNFVINKGVVERNFEKEITGDTNNELKLKHRCESDENIWVNGDRTETKEQKLKRGKEVNETDSTTVRKDKITSPKQCKNKASTRGNTNKSAEVRSFSEKLDQAMVSEIVGDLCEYQCHKCKKVFRSRRTLCVHLRQTKHSIAKITDANSFLIKMVAHKCLLCSEKILCDKRSVSNHLRKIITLVL